MRRRIPSLSTTLLIGGALLFVTATGASAYTTQSQIGTQGFANSATFNAGMGMGPQQQNLATAGTQRDTNGNLFSGGILSGSGSVSQQTGVGGTNATTMGDNFNTSSSDDNSSTQSHSSKSSHSQQDSSSNQDSNTLNGHLDF